MVSLFPRRFAAVVFDLDGTLIDSAPDIAAALNLVLREDGLPPFTVAETFRFVGQGATKLIEDAFAARGVILTAPDRDALTARYIGVYERRGSPETTLYPGVREILTDLSVRKIPLAICTNKPERLSREVVTQFALDTLFSAIICGDSGFGRKPAAAPLQAACQRLGADPAATMMVGDSVTDIRTARAANCTAVIVRGGYTLAPVESFGADAVIASIADVARLLEA